MKRLLFILALVCAPIYGQGPNTARMLSGTNVVTSCPYTMQATDTTKLLIFNSASACAVTLPAATTLNFGAGAIFSVKNQGAGAVTITPATGTIDGAASAGLTTGQGADIYSDGANYSTQTGKGSGAGGSPGGANHDTQCNLGGAFAACANNSNILYVSQSGSDTNSGKTWDSAKLTIMAAVCALPGGNCAASPKVAGAGTVMFANGVSCNSISTVGCWIAGFGDSQYPAMTGAIGGPTAWTVETSPQPLNFICATLNFDGGTQNKPGCQVVGPPFGAGAGNRPLIWVSGNSLGAFYINGMNGTGGGAYTAAWGRIGIDSATGAALINPTVTQTVSFTIENSFSDNMTEGSASFLAGPQLALGNGFWMHLHDDGFSENAGETCGISSMSRASGTMTVNTTGCPGSGTTVCPFITGDHVSIVGATGDKNINGTFTVATGCSGGSSFTFTQAGPTFSGSTGAGVVASDRAFGITCFSCQVEMARMHFEGAGIKFYSGPSSNLQLNDEYMEGIGAQSLPILWISPLIYGNGGVIDVGSLYMSDTPTLSSVINDAATSGGGGAGPLVFVHSEDSQSTIVGGSGVLLNNNDASNRSRGYLPLGQSGWYTNQYFEASTDIARRQVPVTANLLTNLAAQNPASWTGSSFTTASGKTDPFGGTGAIEIDATAGTTVYFYNVTQTPNIGDIWEFGGWVRAASGFQVAGNPFVFYLGGSNLCTSTANQTALYTPFTGDGNWFWLTGSCTVWSNPSNASVALGVTLNASTPVQVYRPFVFKAASGAYTPTEIADELNSLGFGPSTQAAAGDIVYPADKKLGISSGSATNEFLGYLTHSNTANRTYTLPDASGTICLSSSCGTTASINLTGQTASIASTTLYAVPSTGAGMYAVYADIITTTAGTGGTVVVTVAWNNGTTTPNLFSTPFALNAQGEQPALLGTFYSAASQNITYSTTVTNASGSPQYSLRIRLVYLG